MSEKLLPLPPSRQTLTDSGRYVAADAARAATRVATRFGQPQSFGRPMDIVIAPKYERPAGMLCDPMTEEAFE